MLCYVPSQVMRARPGEQVTTRHEFGFGRGVGVRRGKVANCLMEMTWHGTAWHGIAGERGKRQNRRCDDTIEAYCVF